MSTAVAAKARALTAAEERVVENVLSHLIGEMGGWRGQMTNLCRLVAALAGRDLIEQDGTFVEVPFRGSKLEMLSRDLEPAVISRRWTAARRQKRALERDLLEAFFPRWLWPPLADLIARGPDETTREAEEILECWARGLTSNGEADLPRLRSAGTIHIYIEALWRLMRLLVRLQAQAAEEDRVVLEQWTAGSVGDAPNAEDLKAKAANRDRSAPPLLAVRRALRSLDADVQRKKKYVAQRDHMFLELRDRALLAVFAILGARPEAVWRMDVDDFRRSHQFPDGSHGPALALPPVKRETTRHVKALPPDVGEWIAEYLTYINAVSGEPLWRPGERERRQLRLSQNSLEAIVVRRLAPFVGGRVCSPGTLRHLAAKLATLVGIEWIRDRSSDFLADGRGIPSSPEIFAKVLLGHALTDPAHRYRDIDSVRGRESLTKITVEGIWEWLWGEKGARKGPDVAAIVEAEQGVEHAKVEMLGLEEQLNELERQATVAAHLETKELLVLIVQLTSLPRALARATSRYERALGRLEGARTTEVAIDDAATSIPSPPNTAIEFVDCADDERPIVRTEILPAEYCWALGVPASTLRRWMSGKLPHPPGDPRNLFETDAVKKISARQQVVLLDKLDPGRYHVDAWERLLEICRRPAPEKRK